MRTRRQTIRYDQQSGIEQIKQILQNNKFLITNRVTTNPCSNIHLLPDRFQSLHGFNHKPTDYWRFSRSSIPRFYNTKVFKLFPVFGLTATCNKRKSTLVKHWPPVEERGRLTITQRHTTGCRLIIAPKLQFNLPFYTMQRLHEWPAIVCAIQRSSNTIITI